MKSNVAAVMCIIVSVIIALFAIHEELKGVTANQAKSVSLSKHAMSTEGTVTNTYGSGSRLPRVTVEFEFDAINAAGVLSLYRGSSIIDPDRQPRPTAGQRIEVVYDASNPSTSMLDQDHEVEKFGIDVSDDGMASFLTIFTLAVFLIFGVAAAAIVKWRLKQRSIPF